MSASSFPAAAGVIPGVSPAGSNCAATSIACWPFSAKIAYLKDGVALNRNGDYTVKWEPVAGRKRLSRSLSLASIRA